MVLWRFPLFTLNQDQEVAKARHQLERYLFKSAVAVLVRSLYGSRINETPMNTFRVAGEGGTGLANTIAHRHYALIAAG